MSLKKMATELAIPMIEHNLKNGATHLDSDFIAKQACDIAYKINENVKAYGEDDSEMSKDEIKKMIKKEIGDLVSPKSSGSGVSVSHTNHQ